MQDDLREHERLPYTEPVMYSVTVLDMRELKQINGTAVPVDISSKGIGILVDYPLEQGHVLTLKDMVKTGNFTSNKRAAIVKWTRRLDNKYRVGLMFV